jgi:hypothetical protein
MTPSAALSATELRHLLTTLGARLAERGVAGHVLLVGGAAMSLGHGGRRTTRDVDARFEPVAAIREAAQEIAREQGLREDWLNSAAVAFMPPVDPGDGRVILKVPGLIAEVASARVLLAMKLAAFRATDIPDLMILFEELGIEYPDQAVAITRQLYGEHAVVIRDDEDSDLRTRAEEVLDRLQQQR